MQLNIETNVSEFFMPHIGDISKGYVPAKNCMKVYC